MQPLVQNLLLSGLAMTMVMGALPHSISAPNATSDKKQASISVPDILQAVRQKQLASGAMSRVQGMPLRVSTPPAINQYHMQIIEPAPGWQAQIPCLRPAASLRADMPVLQPEGILGTNRTTTPPVRIMLPSR